MAIFRCLVSIMIWLLTGSVKPAEQPTSGYFARSYVVMNRDDGTVLEGHDIHQIRSVASISKIMTCIIAIESDRLFDVIEAPPEAMKQVGSSIYLKEGEKLSLLDLCYGLLLRSGNDAAYSIAVYVGGDLENFVDLMNRKARQLGLNDTTFTNPSGLDIDETGNLSSAHDMALLISYCLENPWFQKIVHTKSYSCQYASSWVNKNKLLHSYPYLDGGKTGYTYKAKRTLVTGATKDGLRLAVCTLDCGSDFSFHKALYEKYFAQSAYVEFLSAGINYVGDYRVQSPKRVGIIVPREDYDDGIKVYRFTVDGTLIEMSYVSKSGQRYKVTYNE